MKFTKIPEETFKNIGINAGVLLDAFTPATPTIEDANILGATSGGINFTATPTFTDFGEDIDNCPKNMKELKKLESWEIKLSGTLITVNPAVAARLMAAADVGTTDATKITPRTDIKSADFKDLWLVCDYSDKNGETNGGYCAIHILNALSTGGFSLQSTDKGKAQFAFEFTGHVSMSAQTVVPFEVFIKEGTDEA